MLSAAGNPTMRSLSAIFRGISEILKVDICAPFLKEKSKQNLT